ncbi:MAG: alpha/beta-type small acid-soluble spore protein [Firmicutes bacterium]|jgi:hypothetical protein|nr:alpha/beta-type small acid-soluble spore protein [Bacillota bacterium]
MGAGQRSGNQVMYPQARQALDQFKYEVANELGIDQSRIVNDYWGYMTSRDCGAVGGNMVRRMIQAAEQALIQQAAQGVKVGFREQIGKNADSASLTPPGTPSQTQDAGINLQQ